MANHLPDLRGGEDRLKGLVGDILAEAKKQGADAAEVSVSEDVGLGVTVRMRDVETLEYHRSQGLGVTVYFGQRKGNASTSDLRPESAIELTSA